MTTKKVMLMMCGLLLLGGCGKLEQNTEKQMTEEIETVESYVEENQQFFVKELKVGETGAKGAAQILEEVGCRKLVELAELEDDGKSYRMTVQDEVGNKFILTMGYDGYIGVVQDMDGNYLYMPVD